VGVKLDPHIPLSVGNMRYHVATATTAMLQ
jgi:hypothetical protein